MRLALFYHSLVSDWNHGNAHFLRGITAHLLDLGHEVAVFEPADGWSRTHLLAEHGRPALAAFRRAYPGLSSRLYDARTLDLGRALDGMDAIIVHEWNDPGLVARLGRHRRRHAGLRLLFHDTHHRLASDPQAIRAFDLSHYDGVLAYGEVLRRLYLDKGLAGRAWTWHEAADTRVFRPLPRRAVAGDVVWIGNWGDEERTQELRDYLLRPVKALGLAGRVYGVRYPDAALAELLQSGLTYGGWLPNPAVPRAFAAYRATVHVPRRPYAAVLPGIPTIRVFEALACGIPLVCAPWEDAENLFRPGLDYLVAKNPDAMRRALADVLGDPGLARSLARNGQRTILARHTCAHRVAELLAILESLGCDVSLPSPRELSNAYA